MWTNTGSFKGEFIFGKKKNCLKKCFRRRFVPKALSWELYFTSVDRDHQLETSGFNLIHKIHPTSKALNYESVIHSLIQYNFILKHFKNNTAEHE